MATTFKQFMSESINDKGVLKAVFVVGMPGAGKSYTVSRISGGVSPRIVNTDVSTEFLVKKWGIESNDDTWSVFSDKTKKMTKVALRNYLNGLLPLFIDGTSNSASNILKRIGLLESLGYDVGMVFVDVDPEVAKRRILDRAKTTGRHVDLSFIDETIKKNKANKSYFKSKISFFKEYVNDGSDTSNEELEQMFKTVQGFFEGDILNPVGQRRLEQMKEQKQAYLSPAFYSKEELDKVVDQWYRS